MTLDTVDTVDAVPTPDSATRKLATIELVSSVEDIPDADMIVKARIRGWDVVVKRDEFSVGDPCVYFEVDSLLDVEDERFAFLAPRGVRTDPDGRSGHVLKTARLRGQYSQGLALPLSAFPELASDAPAADRVGEDVTSRLGVVKWEPPIPASLAGKVRGMRPSWIPATDEERIQNVSSILAARDEDWVATEKVDGTSTTFWVDGDDFGVCTRNLDLLEEAGNTLWKVARSLGIHDQLRGSGLGSRVVLQGETYGEGIQKNPLRLRGHHFAAFTLRVDGVEVPRGAWPEWLLDLSVPTHDLAFPATLEEALEQVDRLKSLLAPDRAAEGIVWRAANRDVVTLPNGSVVRASFKAISNRYLLKNDL